MGLTPLQRGWLSGRRDLCCCTWRTLWCIGGEERLHRHEPQRCCGAGDAGLGLYGQGRKIREQVLQRQCSHQLTCAQLGTTLTGHSMSGHAERQRRPPGK